LNKIKVKGGTIEQKTIFYTALYHSLLAPNLFSDIDGKYRGHDKKTYIAKDFDMYTVFSLWDTFRAEHPLFTIIENKRTTDFIKSMLDIYKRGGLLPVWELAGNETGCMIGYHSVPVIVDAYMKGIRDFDIKLAFNAMKKSAEQNHLGLEFYKKSGYIPADKEGESVSKTLEYAYDDWCIAQMAKKLGKDKDYRKYITRAQYYKNLFDDSTGFFRGKRNETFVTPFDPAEVNFMLTEANTWQYNFFVPQDIQGMIDLLGGNEQFVKKLDEMFYTETKLSGRHQSDITGLIGQYAHGNEPSHHIAYLYDYAGQPWKTQKLVRKIMDDLYSDKPDGLCGNEDCGQMSAWYVLSAMGFYPVTPGDNIYAIGSPIFEKVTINLENGNKFIIKANNVSDDNFYIQSANFNGKPYNKSYLKHSDIIKGGELVFKMGHEPNKNWGTGKENVPVSEIKDFLITPVPYFIADSKTFTKSTEVKLNCILKDAKIYYTLDGSKPDINSKEYTKPLKLNKTTTIKTFAYVNGLLPSKKVTAEFIKIPEGRSIKINNPYSPQYTGGGDIALIDFIRGSNNFRTGDWQGYEGIDLDVIVNLGKIQRINQISTGFLQNQNSWIFMPTHVDYKISTDGKNFKAVGSVFNDIQENYNEPVIKDFTLKNINKKTRYIRVLAKNIVVCPDWHKGAGGKAWIFADEIVVK
ncbi:MAG: GH92 family glycosyl hydrolase, partial [Bacteroidales bacterium]|nr:GH92 family glycosyl hydrolase [Bacteroidales bacterium]